MDEFVRVITDGGIENALGEAIGALAQAEQQRNPNTLRQVENARKHLLARVASAEHNRSLLPTASQQAFDRVASRYIGEDATKLINDAYSTAAGNPADVRVALERLAEELRAQLATVRRLHKLFGDVAAPRAPAGQDILTIRFARAAEFRSLEEMANAASGWNEAFRTAHRLTGHPPGPASVVGLTRGSWEVTVTALAVSVQAVVAMFTLALKAAETRAQVIKFQKEAEKIDRELATAVQASVADAVVKRQIDTAAALLLERYKDQHNENEAELRALLARTLEGMSDFAVKGGRLLAASGTSSEAAAELASGSAHVAQLDTVPDKPALPAAVDPPSGTVPSSDEPTK